MLKTSAQYNKLKRAIILSIFLHCILIAILVWSSNYQLQESTAGNRSSITATIVKQYNLQKHTDLKHPNEHAHLQLDEFKQKQDIEWQQLKSLEKQRVDINTSDEIQQRNQDTQQKLKEIVKRQSDTKQTAIVAKRKPSALKQTSTINVKKAKANQVKKDKSVATKQQSIEQTISQQFSDVDALLSSLSADKNAPKADVSPVGEIGKAKQGNTSTNIAEIDAYKAQVSQAISDKFYDSSSYSGKICDLHIKLAPDGLLISVSAIGGDSLLCHAALSATKLAIIPKPPSSQIYEIFKNATLRFSPQ